MSQTKKILNAATATGTGPVVALGDDTGSTFQVWGSTSSGAGAALVDIDVSNDGVNFVYAGSITLTLGTTSVSDALPVTANYAFGRANVRSISGTGATLNGLAAV